jgi:hypothetical protein
MFWVNALAVFLLVLVVKLPKQNQAVECFLYRQAEAFM